MTEKMTPIDEYIAQCPDDRQDILNKVRDIIKEVLPEAQEIINYGMPTYYQKENLVHFANAKNHIGFYPTPSVIEHFSKELAEFKTSKGAVQFSVSQPIPYDLIRKMTEWRWSQI